MCSCATVFTSAGTNGRSLTRFARLLRRRSWTNFGSSISTRTARGAFHLRRISGLLPTLGDAHPCEFAVFPKFRGESARRQKRTIRQPGDFPLLRPSLTLFGREASKLGSESTAASRRLQCWPERLSTALPGNCKTCWLPPGISRILGACGYGGRSSEPGVVPDNFKWEIPAWQYLAFRWVL
jgi:hypothetical protein